MPRKTQPPHKAYALLIPGFPCGVQIEFCRDDDRATAERTLSAAGGALWEVNALIAALQEGAAGVMAPRREGRPPGKGTPKRPTPADERLDCQ